MTDVAMSRSVRIADAGDFYNMLTNGDFVMATSGGYVFLLGIMLLSTPCVRRPNRPELAKKNACHPDGERT